jgi:D-beta-D-heptose 7-phosphate kinase/D-beta-D-heptose 1-phosphate adenosyltransferase
MKKVLLIGDVMLDINTHGTCTRISPEAPVAIVKKTHEIETLGGAGNNLVNLFHLNIPTDFISVVGGDSYSVKIKEMVKIYSKEHKIYEEKNRIATVKNRILAQKHQVLRIDTEDTNDIGNKTETLIIDDIQNSINKYSIIMISDYNKGVCTENLIKEVVKIAIKNNVKIICDPKKANIEIYTGCYTLTPNKNELETIYKKPIKDTNDIKDALLYMQQYIQKPIATLSENGIAFLDDNKNIVISKAKAKDVVDVTGAGDTAISTICYAIYKGMGFSAGIDLANKAASIVVSKLGTSYVTEEELFGCDDSKVFQNVEDILPKIKNKKVVFTNGCFDIIHMGHTRYLKKAKELGDILIVGINSDDSVKRLKGSTRPVNALHARAEVLSSIGCVDFVIPFSDDTPYNLIKKIQPDVMVKGGDYKINNIVGNDIAKETIVIPFEEGFSTTNIINTIKQ